MFIKHLSNGTARMWPEIPSEEWTAVLDETAKEVLAASAVTQPPIDPVLIASRLGMVVALDNRQAGRARCITMPGHASRASPRPLRATRASSQSVILLRDDPRPERRHWAVAHEIGEQICHRVFAKLSLDAGETTELREHVANLLASRILLPSAAFRDAYQSCDGDLGELKTRFSTASHELIARRMLDLIPHLVIAVFDQGKLLWRRSNLRGRMPPWLPEERALGKQCHVSGQTQLQTAGRWSITAWPIHEPHWKREIIRSELCETWD